MSVPIHNLYDFIQQLTKNKLLIYAFIPFGSKKLSNCVNIFPNDISPNFEHQEISKLYKDNIFFKKKLPGMYYDFVPLLLCYDQEPLNFELYKDHNVKEFKQKQKTRHFICNVENLNLRLVFPRNYFKKSILLHSELQSIEVENYINSDLFVPAYWWSHAIIARDWFRYAEHDDLDYLSYTEKTFLTYSRSSAGTRQYRDQFKNLTNFYSIYHDCQWQSFNSTVKITSNSSAEYTKNDFEKTMISVVLETVFSERIHLTEKTLRPIALGHPFMICNGPGTLEYLKTYGFKTFHPYINESYDQEQDSTKRLTMIVKEMQRISKLSRAEKKLLKVQLQKIAKLNKEIFFGNKFFDQVIAECKNNLLDAYNEVLQSLDWDKIWSMYKKRKNLDPDYFIKFPHQRRLMLTFIKHLKKGGTLEDYVPPDLD